MTATKIQIHFLPLPLRDHDAWGFLSSPEITFPFPFSFSFFFFSRPALPTRKSLLLLPPARSSKAESWLLFFLFITDLISHDRGPIATAYLRSFIYWSGKITISDYSTLKSQQKHKTDKKTEVSSYVIIKKQSKHWQVFEYTEQGGEILGTRD